MIPVRDEAYRKLDDLVKSQLFYLATEAGLEFEEFVCDFIEEEEVGVRWAHDLNGSNRERFIKDYDSDEDGLDDEDDFRRPGSMSAGDAVASAPGVD